MLDPKQIEEYHEHGYLLVENALDAGQLEQLQSITRELIEQSRTVTVSDAVFDLDQGHSSDHPRLTRIKTPHEVDPAFRAILHSERITECLQALLGPHVRLQNSKLNTKAGQGGAAVEWHQDWGFYPHTNDDMLALGFMLSDITEEDGPLLVVPGSHRGPVLPHSNDTCFCGAVDPGHPDAHLDKAVALTGKAGSMSIHHVRLLHGSAPNLSASARLLLLYECCAADAWPINGSQSAYTGLDQTQIWNKLQQNMICGQQPLHARLADVPVLMPLPAAPDASSIFKVQQSGGAVSAFAD